MCDREDTELMDSNRGLKRSCESGEKRVKMKYLLPLDVPQQLGSTAAKLEDKSRSL